MNEQIRNTADSEYMPPLPPRSLWQPKEDASAQDASCEASAPEAPTAPEAPEQPIDYLPEAASCPAPEQVIIEQAEEVEQAEPAEESASPEAPELAESAQSASPEAPVIAEPAAPEAAEISASPEAPRKSAKGKIIGIIAACVALAVIVAAAVITFSSYALINGQLVSLDVSELDLRGEDITIVSEIRRLEQLEFLDLRGNEISMGQYRRLARALPDCRIMWDVPVGDGRYPNTSIRLDLSGRDDFKLRHLRRALPMFTFAESINVAHCGFSDDELLAFEQENGIDLIWNVELCGKELMTNVSCADLRGQSVDIDEIASKMKYFGSITAVDLSDCGIDNDTLLGYNTTLREKTGVGVIWDIAIGDGVYSTGLTELSIEGSEEQMENGTALEDISALRYFTNLTKLRLSGNSISDVSPLAGLTGLRVLSLAENEIMNIAALEGLTKLTWLDLSGNYIANLKPLEGMTKLQYLCLNENQIKNVEPLSGMEKLSELLLMYNEISDTRPLTSLAALKKLSLRSNLIEEVSPLAKLTGLQYLTLYDNPVEREVVEVLIEQMPNCEIYYSQKY
ncbi:MAG: leucine-rich repeat domain-containing protein [Clostridia bacterium]|nr:leucine-rich repeat domain-containing protein [Clostridia bacterium]